MLRKIGLWSAFFAVLLSACQPRPSQEEQLTVVATFFPVADIVQQVGQPHVQVQTLLPADSDLHSFSPTTRQLKQLHEAKAVFALGFGAEPFLDALMRGVDKRKPPLIELGEGCWTLPADASHEHHHHEEEHHHHHEEAIDPHVWLSLQNAVQMVRNAQTGLARIAPQHRETFSKNADALVQEIQALHQQLRQRAKGWKHRRFMAAHGAYRYLAKEAGLEQVAAFEPLPGVEPSARWIRDLMNVAKREGVKVVFVPPPAPPRLVETIAADLGMNIYTIDPLERSLTPYQNYQQRMRRNIETLEQAMR